MKYAALGDVVNTASRIEGLAKERPADGCVAFHLGRLQAGIGGTLIRMAEK